jgi:hypothetical protein
MSLTFRTPELARRLGTSLNKAQELCRTGKIAAVNLSTGKRASWVISEEAYADFVNPKRKYDESKARVRTPRIDAGVKKVF